jgi:hypothetical protein
VVVVEVDIVDTQMAVDCRNILDAQPSLKEGCLDISELVWKEDGEIILKLHE